jgi:ribosomal protein S18 acetylase RimI-like enzyme
MTPQDMRTATQADRESILDTFVLSFAADPCARYLWPKPRDYIAGWRRFAMGLGGRALDHDAAFVTEDGAAAAFWLPPGVESDSDTLGALIEEAVAEEKRAVLGQVVEQMAQFHPHDPHWYLALVGADPARQGEGLGSALIKQGLKACDEQGLPAYLESSNPRNIPLYERHGFEVVATIQPDDFPGLYPMYRPARG